MKIRINMLSKADVAKGQGVASAYREQVSLVRKIDDLDVKINSRSSKFDIYHIHSVNPSYRLRMTKKHLNIVYVHFIPAKNHESIKLPKLAEKIFDWYVNSYYKKADELVVVNPCFTEDLVKLGIDEKKITYIPNYVDHHNFSTLSESETKETKKKYNIPEDKFIVLGCGQIQTRKGIDDFVETAKQNPDIFFVWVGGFSFGRIMHGYRKYRKLFKNLPQNMINIPILDRKYMNEVFNACDVLFMPSYMELFPMTILEIANVYKPVLLRDLDLYKPILFDKYAKGNDVNDFSQELKKLKNDLSYYQEQSNNSKYISDYYNEERLIEDWRGYYKRVLADWKNR
jgi:1,2-diacylglycerol-3-alpha-glucose alpha-1,2-galactosyltransferase